MTRINLPVVEMSGERAAAHARALADCIEGEVRFGQHDRMLYATDASIYQVEPIGVVIPKSLGDVQRVIEYCRDHELPVLPRGGGTSLAGQCVNRAIVLDLSPRFCDIGWISPTTRACRVEVGMTIDDLNDQLSPFGLFFAPDPATARQANIGGVIGNNAAGTRSILYGRTSENIESVSVVLADGRRAELGPGSASLAWMREYDLPAPVRARLVEEREIVRPLTEAMIEIVDRYESLIRERFPKTSRRNAGYALDSILVQLDEARRRQIDPMETVNLSKLICGSEGTLAVVTHATLKLHPLPSVKGLAVIGFTSLDAAIQAVSPLLALKPSAIELLDDLIIDLARRNTEYQHYVRLMPCPNDEALGAVLYVEFFSRTGAVELHERFKALEEVIRSVSPGATVATYTRPQDVEQALKLRKAGEPLLHAIPGSRKPVGFVEDNAVPVERLAEFVHEFRGIVDAHGTVASFYAHASVGVLHVRPLLNLRDESDRRAMETIAVEVADLARSLGGVMSGEHGDGRARGPLLERYFGPELMRAFREVKRLFDPHNLLNPGNIVAPEPISSIHEHTRIRPTARDLPETQGVDGYFAYSHEENFEHAVELCNGAGVCRKKYGGTMCPSYMATLDERHSTRGRGNALRLAISGQFGDSGRPQWSDPETLATLDLCLSCKGCKTECPSNVDVAKYKAEYLAQSYRANGQVPLKAAALARIRALSRFGSFVAPVGSRLGETAPLRLLLNHLLEIAPQRRLPKFSSSLYRRLKWRERRTPRHDAPTVVLYADCFTAYEEPWIGLAAIEALEALGYRVVTPAISCCGRAAISLGVLDYATKTASEAADDLERVVRKEKARAVVVCEPSCLASIKDDWLDLRLDVAEPARRRLATMSFMPEEFIEAKWSDHPHPPKAWNGGERPRQVVFHGHCHQKALWGVETSAAPLRRALGDRVTVLDTGCCGMAGSFGYDRSHYELSMRIGELALFPAIRNEPGDSMIVAPGMSCRTQIVDGTGRRASHPIELIAAALRSAEYADGDRIP